MDGDVVRLGVAAIIGATISISTVALAVARMVSARGRNRELPEASVVRLEARLERVEQAIDAMAVEVERVADGQRLTTRLLSEKQVERQA